MCSEGFGRDRTKSGEIVTLSFGKLFSKFELEWWKVIFESEIFESCSQQSIFC